jgi:hypothetical protein
MDRAVLLIGVRKSGTLPELQAVQSGLAKMRKWVRTQGISGELVKTISDSRRRRVRSVDIYDAVEQFTQLRTLQQLIIYFCGHGVNNDYSEYWLLSDAPTNPNEAVNVALSAFHAERCRIPHVVFVSDACRTAPVGIQASSVSGSAIFPNRPPGDAEASVDLFYACRLGESAYEIADPQQASDGYHAVYTEVLTEALQGVYPALLERSGAGEAAIDLVRPWPLKRGLPDLVTARIIELNAVLEVNQAPYSKVTSDPQVAWLSRLRPRRRPPGGGGEPLAVEHEVAGLAGDVADDAFESYPVAVEGYAMALEIVPEPSAGAVRAAAEAAERLAEPFGPADVDALCGFKVRGGQVEAVASQDGEARLSRDGLVVEVHPGGHSLTASILLRFASGPCAVVPAIVGYMAAVTVEDGQLADIMYQPLRSSPMWDEYQEAEREYVRYRSTLAAASRFGLDGPDAENAERLLSRHQALQQFDPSLKLYLAYALHDLGQRSMITQIRDDIALPWAGTFFDVHLLTGEAFGLDDAPEPDRVSGPVVPAVPLLSRGWPLLGAASDLLDGIASRVPSHWSFFEGSAFEQLRRSLDRRIWAYAETGYDPRAFSAVQGLLGIEERLGVLPAQRAYQSWQQP